MSTNFYRKMLSLECERYNRACWFNSSIYFGWKWSLNHLGTRPFSDTWCLQVKMSIANPLRGSLLSKSLREKKIPGLCHLAAATTPVFNVKQMTSG